MPRGVNYKRHMVALRRWWQAQLPLPCFRCGKEIKPTDKWDLDHKQAVDEGGHELDVNNLAPSHKSCNRAHGATITNKKRSHKSQRTRKWI